jgi:mRNA interferase MazF
MVEINTFQRGGIYLAKLNPSRYNEIAKLRPVVVLTSQKILNSKPLLVFICPLSSKSQEDFKYLHFKLLPRDRLNEISYVLIEHTKSVSVQRLNNDCLSVLTDKELEQIIKNISFMIDA